MRYDYQDKTYSNYRSFVHDIGDIFDTSDDCNTVDKIRQRYDKFWEDQEVIIEEYRIASDNYVPTMLRIEKEIAEKEQLIKELDDTDISTLNQSQKDTLETKRIKAKDELDKLKYLMEEVE